MRITPVFAWYDLWVGAYWDRRTRRLYVLPMPCVGFCVDFLAGRPVVCDHDWHPTEERGTTPEGRPIVVDRCLRCQTERGRLSHRPGAVTLVTADHARRWIAEGRSASSR
jgi:hypothetical protein